MSWDPEEFVIRRTLRLPLVEGPAGDGAAATRQFDAVLMSVGFKLSSELFARLSALAAPAVIDTAVRVLPVVRRMAGAHVQHNAYFKRFPANVPDTVEFWLSCLLDALTDELAAARIEADAEQGLLNLLALPKYGRYQHSYADLVAAHDELLAAPSDRVTVLHSGAALADEVSALYLALAGSAIPLGDDDAAALRELALYCATGPQPPSIPVREHRAIVNEVRLAAGAGLLVDTVTDVLRLACLLSEGDVSLLTPTRFRSLPRRTRRALLAALDAVVAAQPAKLGDVAAHREAWKRLGERLHPHEFPRWPDAAAVFEVARGERRAPSFLSRLEDLLSTGEVATAAELLCSAPGLLFRSLDRLLRAAATDADRAAVLAAVEATIGAVSGRVLISVREHLENRAGVIGSGAAADVPVGSGIGRRVFTNRLGRGRVFADTRAPIDTGILERLCALLDAELRRRLPARPRVVIDPDMLDVALPLSGKGIGHGLGVLPRGSVSRVHGGLLRFFVYWHERSERTDFDLSALLLDADFEERGWLSYTNLTEVGGTHSGDITEAPDGASEFIEIDLHKVRAFAVLPQVNIYTGEGFDEVRESFFGFMLREAYQAGLPYEPRTVRMKSELRGAGRVAFPLVFFRYGTEWRVKWLHLNLAGEPDYNRVEENSVTTSDLARAVLARKYLGVGYLAELMGAAAELWDGETLTEPVTFIGLTSPDGLPAGCEVFTPENLGDLIPS
ncbi:TerD family protein [Nocardia yamanashiensis]|uniref:TerD family protein n=1 Tax=Nocardia yamanashiensis TaxID=209247 RepID=UPI00082B8DC1|nr:TerD family protein [Nocardia yamanashiensis]